MSPGPRIRAITSTLALLAGSAVSVAVLIVARPHVTGGPAAWSGDDVAIGTAWIVAIACAAWLTFTTIACLGALARGRTGAAIRIAAFAPPIARRMLQAALVTSVVVLPTAAYAAAPPAPLVLHVGAGGRLTTGTEGAPVDEVPVVRAPPTTSAAPVTRTGNTSAPRATSTTVPSQSPTAAPTAPPESIPAPVPNPVPIAPPVRTRADRTYVVRAGDNLWRIADAHVSGANGLAASDETIAPYWQRLIAANRTTLRSGDPSLIFPGEVIALPLD